MRMTIGRREYIYKSVREDKHPLADCVIVVTFEELFGAKLPKSMLTTKPVKLVFENGIIRECRCIVKEFKYDKDRKTYEYLKLQCWEQK